MNSGQACRPCRGSCSPIPGRGCFGDLVGDEIVLSPLSPIVELLGGGSGAFSAPSRDTVYREKAVLQSMQGTRETERKLVKWKELV